LAHQTMILPPRKRPADENHPPATAAATPRNDKKGECVLEYPQATRTTDELAIFDDWNWNCDLVVFEKRRISCRGVKTYFHEKLTPTKQMETPGPTA
jgi:hypothetical protein